MEKTFKSTQKYLIESPRKLRLVVGLIKKMSPLEAIEKLPFASRRAAGDLIKVIKSAMANAKNQGISDTELIFKEIQIGEGPRLKRGKAASRGRWHPFKKRMSHVRVVLTTKPVKSVKKEEVKAEVVEQEKTTEEVKVKEVKKVKKGADK